MKWYTVEKVLNNNVVLSEINGDKFILVGNGIGFNKKKGDKIYKNKVENIFISKSAFDNNFENILENIDSKIVGICEEIITMCEIELNLKLNHAIHVSLPDHINFAFHRIKKGIKIENPFLIELSVLYSKEYKLAEKALKMVNNNFDIKLPEDEVGFICMHINAAINQEDVGNVLAYTKKIGTIMDFISKILKKKIEKNSMEYLRTVTHINFVLDRVINKKTIKNYLLDNIKKQLYNEYDLAIKVALKIESLFSIKIPEDEIGYIALHLERLREV